MCPVFRASLTTTFIYHVFFLRLGKFTDFIRETNETFAGASKRAGVFCVWCACGARLFRLSAWILVRSRDGVQGYSP